MNTKPFRNCATADLWALLAELETSGPVDLPYTRKLISNVRAAINERTRDYVSRET